LESIVTRNRRVAINADSRVSEAKRGFAKARSCEFQRVLSGRCDRERCGAISLELSKTLNSFSIIGWVLAEEKMKNGGSPTHIECREIPVADGLRRIVATTKFATTGPV
jgi:hypothetical protein